MLKPLKTLLVLSMVMGVLAGCSSNRTAEDVEEPIETTEGVEAGQGVSSDDVFVSDVDGMENVDNVFYFEFDSAVLTPEARSALLVHAEDLKATSRSARLEGHADERGSREYNMALGERRANAVRDFLVLQGVSRSQLETISYGEERPLELGSSEFSWSKNRRVELK